MRPLFTLLFFCLSFSLTNAQLIFLLQEENPIKVPFRHNGDLMLVDVILEDRIPLKFILDTGAENCVLFDREISTYLGLKEDKTVVIRGSNIEDTIVAQVVRRVKLKLSTLENVSTDMLVLEEEPKNLSALVGEDIHGILGASFFSNFVLEVNSKRRELRFFTTSTWAKERLNKFETTPILVNDGRAYIETPITIGTEQSSLRFLLDSGAAIGLLLHHNTFKTLSIPEKRIGGTIGSGISGDITGFLAKVDRFNFGNIEFTNVISSFQTFDLENLEQNGILRNGIIGNQIMRRYVWAIDYSQKKLYTRAYKRVKKAFPIDKSGLSIMASGASFNSFQVHYVRPNSPSDLAGVKIGDELVKLQGLKSEFYNLEHVNKILSGKPDKKIRMAVKRNEEIVKLKFRLEDLL